jgi:hypothetical protein
MDKGVVKVKLVVAAGQADEVEMVTIGTGAMLSVEVVTLPRMVVGAVMVGLEGLEVEGGREAEAQMSMWVQHLWVWSRRESSTSFYSAELVGMEVKAARGEVTERVAQWAMVTFAEGVAETEIMVMEASRDM